MRFSLLMMGLLAAPTLRAQSLPDSMRRQPASLPLPAAIAGSQARLTKVVTLPGTSMNYAWSTSSRVWTPSVLRTTTYTADAQPLVEQEADSATQVPTKRTTYTYTASGRVRTVLQESWNSGFVPVKLNTYTYDSQDRVVHSLAQMWQNGAWQNNNLILISWDAQGNETERTSATWTNNAWVTRSGTQHTYRYSSSGSVLELITSGWIIPGGGFSPHYRELYTYGANPQQWTSYVVQTNVSGTYVNNSRYSNWQYDAQGRQTYYESESWSGSAWQMAGRCTVTYPATGPGYTIFNERYAGSSWSPRDRARSIYDANGNQTELYSELWQANAWVPVSGQRFLLHYNASDVLDQRITQNVNATTGTFGNSTKERYSNFQTITLAARPAARLLAAASLYPNPAAAGEATTLLLEGLRGQEASATIEVLNALGQVVHAGPARVQQGRIERRLVLRRLPAGLYTVRVRTAEGIVAKTLVQR